MRIILTLFFLSFSLANSQNYNFNQFINYKVTTEKNTSETPVFADSLNNQYVLKLYPGNLGLDNARIFDKRTSEIHFLKLTQTDSGINSEYLYTSRMKSTDQPRWINRKITPIDSLSINIKWQNSNRDKEQYIMNCKLKPKSKVKNGLMLLLFSTKNGGSEEVLDKDYPGIIESCSTTFANFDIISYQEVKMTIQIPVKKKYEKKMQLP